MRLSRFWRVLAIVLFVIGAPILLAVASVSAFPPVVTPLMVLRTIGYQSHAKIPAPEGWKYKWVPLNRISPALPRAVIAAEDTTFCSHRGFDEKAYQQAWEKYREGVIARGGSTITQQTTKNVFLWPGRSVVRKALETILTPLVESIWGKRRIMEVYLNVVEWAPGVYGAEAASQYHFRHSAAQLTEHEAARLAAVLPNPRAWSASKPGPYVQSRVGTIIARSAQVATGCLK